MGLARDVITSFVEAIAYLFAIVLGIATLAFFVTGQVMMAGISVLIIVVMWVGPKLWKRWRSQGDLVAEEM